MELTLIFSLFGLVVLALIIPAIQGITGAHPVRQPEDPRSGGNDDAGRM